MQDLTTVTYDKQFRITTLKIGIAMIVFYELINILNLIASLEGELFRVVAEAMAGEEYSVVVLTDTVSEIFSMLAYIGAFLIPAFVLKLLLKRGKTTYEPIAFRPHVPSVAPLIVLAAIALNFAAARMNNLVVSLLFPAQNTDMSVLLDSADAWYKIVLELISVAVIPAFVEEILFRGVILSNLMPYGRGVAILESAVLFGLMHGNILQFFYTTLMGIVLGFVCVKTKSIWCGVGIHFFNNAVSVAEEAILHMADYDLAVRLLSVLEGTIMIAGAVSVVILLILRAKRPKPEEHGSFGMVYEPSLEYAARPLTKGKKARAFFSPTMIVFTALSCVSMVSTLLAVMVAGAM